MHRLPGLDLLRAIAIVWVMLFHSWMIGGLGAPYQPIADYGWMGVDLFFVLSGYLIGFQLLEPLSHGAPLRFGAFYLRRAFRILPAFLAMLAVYALCPSWREAPGMQPLWQFPTFTMNLLIDYRHNQAFSHAWSLCVEEHFYLLFPLLAWWLARSPSWRRSVGVGLAVVAVGMLLRAQASLRGLDYLENIYYPTWTRLDGLLAGVTLAAIQAWRKDWWAALQTRAGTLAWLGLLVTGAAIVLFRHRFTLAASVFGYPLLALGLALLVASAASPRGWLGRRRMPGAGWIAAISYSLYLSHKMVFHAVAGVLTTRPLHGWAAFAAYAAAVLAAGTLLHYAVERPFLRLRTRLGMARDPAAVVEAAPA
ncbi:acyltransferase [Rhodanobacter denitrificans]|uniref:Acyltransferase n=1 Tax=Rhodanobacter denitrificans TaxID=666685 RepID=A0A368KFX0_9GAMM|nr:acyltransferase [Rhodanobacter denitrificans]RCS30802.1 acyltransferase [Rhodanobacter denitrificans]